MLSKEFLEKMKERLLEEKEKFQDELESLQSHTEFGDDEDENAGEYQNDEVVSDIISQLQKDIARIDAALKRIEDGTYGISTVSGKEISEARLEVLPWAETTVDEEGSDSFVA